MGKSRTAYFVKNSTVNVFQQVVNFVTGFVFRTCFLYVLSANYLGLNGLFSNVLSILSLANLGIGLTIAYRLYKPLATGDTEKIKSLMLFFKRVYLVIAAVVLGLGLCLLPFLKLLIKNTGEIPSEINIYVIFLLFLLESVSSYLFTYKQTVMTADQKGFKITIFSIVFSVLSMLLRTLVLFVTKKYLLVLSTGIAVSVLGNFLISLYINKHYPYIKTASVSLDKEEKKAIFKETYALLLHRIGGTVVFSTDNILISLMFGIGILGIFSNYSLITTSLIAIVNAFFSATCAGVGNLQVEAPDQIHEVYFRVLFLNFWVAGFCAISFMSLVNSFIAVWLGGAFLMNKSVAMVLAVSFFISVSRFTSHNFLNHTGFFALDKYRPLIEAAINLLTSILLALWLGIVGIFLGTIVGMLFTMFWREPILIYKHVFKKSSREYWLFFVCAFSLIVGAGALTYFLCSLMPSGAKGLVFRFLICLFVPNTVFLLCTFKRKETVFYLKKIRAFFKRPKAVKSI